MSYPCFTFPFLCKTYLSWGCPSQLRAPKAVERLLSPSLLFLLLFSPSFSTPPCQESNGKWQWEYPWHSLVLRNGHAIFSGSSFSVRWKKSLCPVNSPVVPKPIGWGEVKTNLTRFLLSLQHGIDPHKPSDPEKLTLFKEE